MNKKAVKYNQRIGDLVVKFVDYMQTADETPTDALEIFGIENALSANETYQMSLYLKQQGYQIDPLIFHPDYTGEEDDVTFQEYDDAHIVFFPRVVRMKNQWINLISLLF